METLSDSHYVTSPPDILVAAQPWIKVKHAVIAHGD